MTPTWTEAEVPIARAEPPYTAEAVRLGSLGYYCTLSHQDIFDLRVMAREFRLADRQMEPDQEGEPQ